ncbi:MAG TPA: hypothetical protein VNW15_05265 [Rhizomicrobium sp.]|jgi:hypothetical protein|nr:hypothetical protein [Rhizomicrobium sp.]
MRNQLLCFFLLLAAPAQAQGQRIPAVGECFDVRGKVYLSSNSGVVFDTDTQRYFLAGRDDCFPATVKNPMTNDFRAVVAGAYRICREPDDYNQFGVMHIVCIKTASGLSVSRY